MANILFIADYFADQVPGGGELNNKVLVEKLYKCGHTVRRANSHLVKHMDILHSEHIIVSNFANLSEGNKKNIQNRNYIIYEHDHKYLPGRNPGIYPEYRAPKEHIINRQFYANAKAVLCQSQFHEDIARKNLELNNIVSLGGNLWSGEYLSLLEEICKDPQRLDRHAIIMSNTKHKNTVGSINYCKALGLEYDVIPPLEPTTFLRELGSRATLVFFPETPETLSRVVVEARMMGMGTKTTNNIGAIHEEWFSKKGLDLIEYMRYKQHEIINIVLE
ncbi:MAG: hypothetical protein CMM25_06520, partial [Rhodospirillaceae bacterium]|nr:hypothetical protein [Rhodospirillaceae bacterium]